MGSATGSSTSIPTGSCDVCGPFELGGAARAYSFPGDFTTLFLSFEALDTSGGNTGLFELAGYGQAPAP